jgi:tetratricopeptide (TPR) repeat protein
MATIARAWSLLDQELTEDAIKQMRQGLDAYQATGAEILHTHFLAALGHALSRSGRFDEGLHLLEEGLEVAHRTGEKSCEAELCRLKGELLLMQNKAVAQAEGCFYQAIRIARWQGARSWNNGV